MRLSHMKNFSSGHPERFSGAPPPPAVHRGAKVYAWFPLGTGGPPWKTLPPKIYETDELNHNL
jgi:hypothetical protein